VEPPRPRPTLLHRVEYAALRALTGVLAPFGPRAGGGMAAAIAGLGYSPLRIRRGVVERQIAAAFPELHARGVARIARESYENLGRVAIEAMLLSRGSARGVLDRARIAEHARAQIAAFDIRPADAALPASALSGGNQQKVVIARELSRGFTALLAAQPTRGVDVGAIEFIHGELRRARAEGKAVLLVSAELREVLTLSDRIAVMYGGRLVAVMPRHEASEAVLGPWMTGAKRETAA